MSYESSSGPKSAEQDEPLSATAMFLRSLESQAVPAEDSFGPGPAASLPGVSPNEWPTESAPAAATPKQGPGDFTKMFQAMGKPAENPPVAPQAPPPAYKPEVAAAPQPGSAPVGPNAGSASAPGEFTRLIIASSTVTQVQARTVIEPPALPPAQPAQPTPAAPPKLKGFSSPGVSDSASGEGSFTQMFKPVSQPSSSAAPPAGSATGIFGQSAPAQSAPPAERPWKPEVNLSTPVNPPQPQAAAPAGPSITGFVSALSSPAAPVGARPAEPVPYRPEPVAPGYQQPIAASPGSTPEAGSVTRLINRLSQVEAVPSPPPLPVAAPPVAAGPGEFTKMIAAFPLSSPAATPAPPVAAPPPGAPPAGFALPTPQIPTPHIPAPHLPTFPGANQFAAAPQAGAAPGFQMPPPAAPQIPMQMPKFEAPKAPALPMAAPKGKLEAMVPILLVVNTFLLIVLLIVVIFGMKH